MEKYQFPLPEKISTNEIYAGVHWNIRSKHKNNWRSVLCHWFKKIPQPEVPFILEIEFHLKRLIDCDNCGYMSKLIIDCLVHSGIIADDNPKVIKGINTRIFKTKEPDYAIISFLQHSS